MVQRTIQSSHKKNRTSYDQMSFLWHSKCVFCSAGSHKKPKNKSWVQMVLVNILLIVVVGLTYPWITTIFYMTLCALTRLLFLACLFFGLIQCSQCCCVCLFLLNICLFIWICVSPCVASLSVYMYLSISFLSKLFLLVPTDLPGTLALNCSLFLFLPHSPPISPLVCGVSVSQAGRPWSDLGGNELLITSQETRYSTPTPPPSLHPMQHTHTHKIYTAIACSAHKEK